MDELREQLLRTSEPRPARGGDPDLPAAPAGGTPRRPSALVAGAAVAFACGLIVVGVVAARTEQITTVVSSKGTSSTTAPVETATMDATSTTLSSPPGGPITTMPSHTTSRPTPVATKAPESRSPARSTSTSTSIVAVAATVSTRPAAAPCRPPAPSAASRAGRLVFAQEQPDGSHDLFASAVDGSDRQQLTATPPPFNESMPAWSPDGTRILFTKFTSTGTENTDADIWVMNADGSGQRRVFADGYTYRAVWSLDGRTIKVPTAGGTATVALDGNIVQQSNTPFGDLAPNGAALAYDSLRNSKGSVMVAAPDGSSARDLLPDPAYDEYPRWSPSSDCLALSVFGLGGGPGLYVMNADGQDLRRVASTPGGATLAAWSPDASSLVYDERLWNGTRWVTHLVVMDADGSDRFVVPATDGAWAPSWSPRPQAS